MVFKSIHLFLILSFTVLVMPVLGQNGFTINTDEGCVPMLVNFIPDNLSGDSYTWTFGNGNSSTEQSPVATYTQAGTYTATLVMLIGGNSYTSSQTITVLPNPVAQFDCLNASNDGCAPLTVNFTNQSLPSSSPIVNWQWDFGDGSVQNYTAAINPEHTYTFPGTFSVALTVSDLNGCSNTLVLSGFVHASGGPSIQFSATPNSFCQVPANVQFQNFTTGIAPISYLWQFGDLQSSMQENPLHSYGAFGNYPVTLFATDGQGCTDSVTYQAYVVIDTVEANFSVPEIVCIGEEFTPVNSSENANLYSWQFNPGSSTGFEPTFSYNQGGSHTIYLTVTLDGNCITTHSETIYVETASASIMPDSWYLCKLPDTVTYSNFSVTNSYQGGLSYEWILDFAQITSNLAQPSTTYYWVNDFYEQDHHQSFYDTLIITSPNGCTDTVSQQIVVWLPVITFGILPGVGCAPLEVSFNNGSYYNSPYDSILSYHWDFGNGTSYTGYSPPNIVYPDTGSFLVQLSVTTAMGCDVPPALGTVQVGQKQNASFNVLSPDTICAWDGVDVQNISSNQTFIDNYQWYTSDGEEYLAFDPEIAPLDTGWLSIHMVVSQNGCLDDTILQHAVYVKGPIIKMQTYSSCEAEYLYHYSTPIAIDFDHFYWDFGDGSPYDSVNLAVDYLYTHDTTSISSIYAVNDTTGCFYADSIDIDVMQVDANVVTNGDWFCSGSEILFDASQCLNADFASYYGDFGYYIWNYGDGTMFYYPLVNDSSLWLINSEDTMFHSYAEPGTYTLQVVIVDDHGCADTASVDVVIVSPEPEFNVDPPGGCAPVTCSFTDVTQYDTTIVSWFWDFGQGDTSILEAPPSITYDTGSYYIKLTLQDTLGCVGTDSLEIVSSLPQAQFDISSQVFCLDDTLYMENNSITFGSNPIFIWDFGDTIISGVFEPYHIYSAGGSYTIQLIVNDGGCLDTTVVNGNNIQVQNPEVEMAIDVSGVCAPVHVSYSYSPSPQYITAQVWTFGDSGSSVLEDPQHTYFDQGTYTITLFTTTTSGCSSVDSAEIEVVKTDADFNISDQTICLNDEVVFNITDTLNLGDFLLDFGDGNYFNDPSDLVLVHPHQYNYAPVSNQLFPVLIYWDPDSSCVNYQIDSINILDVRAFFDRGLNDKDTAGCGSLEVQFYNHAVGADSYSWNFGNGNYTSLSNPEWFFADTGMHWIELTVQNLEFGCTVSEGKYVYVFPLPEIECTADPELCLGDSIQLWASGGIDYHWFPDLYISNTNISNPWVNPPESMEYKVAVKNEYDCISDSNLFVYVQTEPEMLVADTFIVVGDYLTLPVPSNQHVDYYWSPPDGLDCPSCPDPGIHPENDQEYIVEVSAWANDKLCYFFQDTLNIHVYWAFSVDVPNLFTPNGDGINDILYPDGWGIKELVSFKIFNRWGQKVFESHDISIGWDGTYHGMKQAIDTYSYIVEVRTYSNEILTKRGTFQLIR